MTTWTESMDGTKSVVYLQADGFDEAELATIPSDEEADHCGYIVFQHGPIKEVGRNGTTIEGVIDVLVNRLEGFQRGPFANQYNADAAMYMKAAKQRLLDRTRDREARGVEGVNLP